MESLTYQDLNLNKYNVNDTHSQKGNISANSLHKCFSNLYDFISVR